MTLTDDDLFSFGTLLKAFRKGRHLTQQQLADAVGVHRSALVRWEQGDHLPQSKALVLELARHLKLDDQQTRHLLEASLTALVPHWSVPLPRNPYFTGREEVLSALHAQLGVEQAVALTQSSALHGLGGVGKTQIALEYAYRYALEYSAVFWIGAETEEQIISSFLHIAQVLQLSEREEKNQQRVIAAVQRWLSSHGPWLLIWDNVEEPVLLDRFLPATRSGAILFTTRRQALGTLARGLDLAPMEQEEGMVFLLRRAKMLHLEASVEQVRQLAAHVPAQYQTAVDLVMVLGGLPLALDQAGAYLEETHCGLPAYLELFGRRRTALLRQRGKSGRDHPESVATTFRLSITTATHHHPAIEDLLRVCALLQPDAIPEEIFLQGAEYLGNQLSAVCQEELEWNQVVALACGYSLLSRQSEQQTLSLHRLLQAVLFDELSEAEREQWNLRVIQALDAVFPEILPETETRIWQQCERLMPHASLCLQRVGADAQSLAFASLACKIAQYHSQRGRYTEGERLLWRALLIREKALEVDHPRVADVHAQLATLYTRQGKYEQAEPFYLRALAIWEQASGPHLLPLASALADLADLYTAQGKYERAEPLFLRAQTIGEQAVGSNHPLVANVLMQLAILYTRNGKYERAESLLLQARAIWEQVLGGNHPNGVRPLYNLAVLYQEQGKYEQAEQFFLRALAIWEQALGGEHPRIAYPLHGLADLSTRQGKYEQAEPLWERALSLWERTLGSEHPFVALALNGLAKVSAGQGCYAQAQMLHQRALQISERSLGPQHPDVALLLHDLATLLRKQGKYGEAEPLYQRALSISEHHLGPHHPQTAEILHDLALLRKTQGLLSEATALTQRALSILSQSLGEAHPRTITTRALSMQLQEELVGAVEGHTSELSKGESAVSGCTEDAVHNTSRPLHTENALVCSQDNPLQGFLDACCERHPRAWCRSADLWQAYIQWVAQHQERFPLTRRAFAVHLKAQGLRADHTHEARIWRGITLMREER